MNTVRRLADASPANVVTFAEHLERFDLELARILARRIERRSAKKRTCLDNVENGIRRTRATLVAIRRERLDARRAQAALRVYRWCVRIARELEAIDARDLSPAAALASFAGFAVFARAAYDAQVAPTLSAIPTAAPWGALTWELATVKRALGAVPPPLPSLPPRALAA